MSTTTSVTLGGPGVQTTKPFHITVNISATIEIDALTAQRRATAWLVSKVGDRLLGDTPTLVIGEQTVWRIPVLLTSATLGVLGTVGTVDVDAVSGHILNDQSLAQELATHARQLARSSSSSTE